MWRRSAAGDRLDRMIQFSRSCEGAIRFKLVTLLLLVVVLGLIAFAISGDWDGCDNEVVAEFPSPDGARKVVIFQRDCGATTGFSTQASLLAVGVKKPSGGGNLFVADTGHGAAPAAAWGGPELVVRWKGPRAVILEHNRLARVFKAERHVEDIEVQYLYLAIP